MKNVMYKIIMGCYAASTQKAESRGNRRNTLPTGAWRLLPTDYLSDTLFPAGRQREAGNGQRYGVPTQ